MLLDHVRSSMEYYGTLTIYIYLSISQIPHVSPCHRKFHMFPHFTARKYSIMEVSWFLSVDTVVSWIHESRDVTNVQGVHLDVGVSRLPWTLNMTFNQFILIVIIFIYVYVYVSIHTNYCHYQYSYCTYYYILSLLYLLLSLLLLSLLHVINHDY